MKKTGIIFLAAMVSSCWSGGRLDLFEWRNHWVEEMQSQPVEWFADDKGKSVKTEYITENNYKFNEVYAASKGSVVIDKKTYVKEYRTTPYLRANMDGALSSGSVPVVLKRNEKKKVLGSVMMGDEECFLVQTDLDDYVIIIRDDGTFYPNLGKVKNKKLIVMQEVFVPYPENLRFDPVLTTQSIQSRPVKGFDLKYNGMKHDNLLFVYFDYSDAGEDSGSFRHVSYAPTETGMINIDGIKVKVMHASDQRLDYMVVE